MASVKSLGIKLLCGVVASLVLVPAVMAAGPSFNDPGFANTWNRVDKPLLDLPGGVGRGYTWGPVLSQATQVTKEPYNGGQRTVQYFDKVRMEVNNPCGNPDDLFYVTTGLLVKELVTGKRQDGDNSFSQQQPSEVQVAGDTNEFGGNQVAPTYSSFRYVGTFFQAENSQTNSAGKAITNRINRAGNVSNFTPPEQRLVKGYDPVAGHNIADVFTDYGNISGPVWDGSKYVDGSVFFGSPLYVFGRPITEPYWVRAVVKGVEQDVLVQLFERRVLTYTPTNPTGFKVEMGNVGQHYYRWRYIENRLPAQAPTKLELVSAFGRDTTGNKNPFYIAPDSQDNFYTASNNGNQLYRFDSQSNFLSSLGQAVAGNGQGQFDGIKALALDGSDNLYVADSGNHRIQKFDAQGHFLLQWSVPQRSVSAAGLNDPFAMAVTLKDDVYVLDLQGVRHYDSQGQLLASWGSPGPADSQLNSPKDIGVDEQGMVYILDNYAPGGHNFNVERIVKKFDSQGHFLLKWQTALGASVLTVDRQGIVLVGLSRYDSNGKTLASFYQAIASDPDAGDPFKPGVDPQGNVYTGSEVNSAIFKLDITGKLVAKYFIYGHKDGQLRNPFSVAVDANGNVYVYDGYNFRIQKFDKEGHFLLKWGSLGKEDGHFNSAQVNVAVDDQGNVYSVDTVSRWVQKFDSQGNFQFKFQATNLDVSCNGLFTEPTLITVDSVGNIYVFDSYPDTSCVEKFDREGHFLSHFGGGFGDKEGQFQKPTSMAVDRQGNLYIADGNYRICKYVTSSGAFQKCWGSSGIESAQKTGLSYLAIDLQGNVYAADMLNNRLIKYDSQGNVLTYWDNPLVGIVTGASMGSSINGIVLDGQNNLYAVDTSNDQILKFKLTY